MRIIYSVLLLCFGSLLIGQSLRINEVLPANNAYLDEDGDASDWIEIYNKSDESIDLTNWSVSDNLSDPDKWTFPTGNIESDGHLLIWASGKNRDGQSVNRTLIDVPSTWKYIIPNQTTNANWIDINFDDSNWSTGSSGFGYGDGDDNTSLSPGTRSVFIRKTFEIPDPSNIQNLILDIDYDDAFVVYINGKEIARENINGDQPDYNDTPNEDREAQFYQFGTLDRIQITNVEDLLLAGQNNISISVHNISNSSSDMTMIPYLSAGFFSDTDIGISPPEELNLNSGSEYHTSFKLSEGETVYLFDPQGVLRDSIQLLNVCPNVSYGVSQDLSLKYFDTPTPRQINDEISYLDILETTLSFTPEGGMTNSSNVTISSDDPDAIIRYTLNGSEPTSTSSIFVFPISLNGNLVIRASAFKDDYIKSKTETRFFLKDATHELPIVSLVTNPENLFDEDIGIYAFGTAYESNFPFMGANFWEDVEIPMHVSLYESNGITGFNIDAGAKIFGGYSRANDQRSFSIFARSSYGEKQINHPIYPDLTYDTFGALVLRNSGNDWLASNMRDIVSTSLMKGSGLSFQAYKSVATYVNGEYWGMYNLREKVNEHFIASKNNVNADEIDLLELEGVVIEGDNIEYQSLISFIENNSMTDDQNYDQAKALIDIDNFIMYQVAQIYLDNTDWPGNNIKFWKSPDTKWRWILYDTDFSFGRWNNFSYTNNTLNFALNANGPDWPNPPWSTFLFRRLVENIDFRNQFINRFADEMNSRFLPAAVESHIENVRQSISSEINSHFSRWGSSANGWAGQVQVLKNFAEFRPGFIKGHIRGRFNLPDYHELTIENNMSNAGYVKVNSLNISESNWIGDYFENVPIDVTAIPYEGYTFSHWEGQINSTEQALNFDLKMPSTLIPIFEQMDNSELSGIIINEINYNSSEDFNTEDWIEIHNRGNDIMDVSNWKIKDSDDQHVFTFPQGTLIDAQAYIVVCNEQVLFESLNPEVSHVFGNMSFGLSKTSDQVRLFNQTDDLIDMVEYTSDIPWPQEANGQGFTLELISPELDNSLPEHWASVHFHGSPGLTNKINSATEEEKIIQTISCYPNPTKGQTQIFLDVNIMSDIEYSLTSLDGQIIIDRQFIGDLIGDQTISIDMSTFQSGIYLLDLNINGQSHQTLKLVKI